MSLTTKELVYALQELPSNSGLNADKLDGVHASGFMKVVKADWTDINDFTVAGSYQIRAIRTEITNRPEKGTSYPNILVIKGEGAVSDTLTQLYFNYDDGNAFIRSGNTVAGSGNYINNKSWLQLAFTSSNVASSQKLQDTQGVYLDRDKWNALVARVAALENM